MRIGRLWWSGGVKGRGGVVCFDAFDAFDNTMLTQLRICYVQGYPNPKHTYPPPPLTRLTSLAPRTASYNEVMSFYRETEVKNLQGTWSGEGSTEVREG